MSEVSVIGLGLLGSALARALLAAGYGVTVWNRSPQKTAPLQAAGAKGAAALADAVAAAPLLIVAVDGYAASRALFTAPAVAPLLAGKTLVQAGTGTPQEARESAAWAAARGAAYIDGAIMAYADQIGEADTRLLFAGPAAAFACAAPYLRRFGGDLRYLGENVAAAAVLDMAWLATEMGSYLGVLQGAAICRAEGVPVGRLAGVLEEGSGARRLAEVIDAEAYADPAASLAVWAAAARRLKTLAEDSGIDAAIPQLMTEVFARAMAAGYGAEDVAAAVKVL